jgi:hypothetical protein
MRILSVQSTVMPDGYRIQWQNGMPQHKYLAMDSQLYNRWVNYIQSQLYPATINTVRPGGVGHIEGQESFLKQMKEVIA